MGAREQGSTEGSTEGKGMGSLDGDSAWRLRDGGNFIADDREDVFRGHLWQILDRAIFLPHLQIGTPRKPAISEQNCRIGPVRKSSSDSVTRQLCRC